MVILAIIYLIMENEVFYDYNSLFRRHSRFRRVASSGIKDITKTIHRNNRDASIPHREIHTIETDGPLRNVKVRELNKNHRLPQLVIIKGGTNTKTIDLRDTSRKMSMNKVTHRVDQFHDLFPRRVSDITEKYSATEPANLRSATHVAIKRRNHPKVLKSNFPFGEEIIIRKPFSQQLKKRTIQEPKEAGNEREFASVEEGLFTFYPKENTQQQMINQFLQIQ